MRIKKIKEVTSIKEVEVAVQCDVCGNQTSSVRTLNWHSFQSESKDLGNDGHESIEHYDVCSADCYWIKFEECVKALEGHQFAQVDCFEIQFARKLIEKKNAI